MKKSYPMIKPGCMLHVILLHSNCAIRSEKCVGYLVYTALMCIFAVYLSICNVIMQIDVSTNILPFTN